ncbi:placenta growth factor [Tiliqua scincoides]|uniref:placenta growth factor n=1 Tax=Tiliqua scincoides TaxID=71010 RepID=UPI003461B165
MQLLGRLLVALALQAACAQRQDKFAGNRTAEVGVVSFHDVWNRSSCQPIEKLVDVVSEYPREVEHMFSPSCVSLHRCSGCCGDERLQCVPTQTANITMQLLKMSSEEQAPYVELTFLEHRECVCRPRKGILKLGRRRRPKGRSKRKWARQKLKD